MKNTEIARILREVGGYYEIKNTPFKPRAYERAADSLAELDEQAGEIYKQGGVKGLLKIPGIGQGMAEHIEELLKTGKLKVYVQLKKQMPIQLTELTSIEGIGPKTAGVLYKKLKIRNLQDLKKAVARHKLAGVTGFGEKTEQNILKALDVQNSYGKRYLLGQVYPVVQELRQSLLQSGLFGKLEAGGSFRRRQETVGDIDLLAVADNPAEAMDFFVRQKDTDRVLEHGKTKSVITLDTGLRVDLRIVPLEAWGAALQYFTGDLAHNIKMRKIAISKGYKLSEYGITPHSPPSRGGKRRGVVKFSTEEEVYRTLGMDYIEPELRTDSGEIEAAQAHKLPKLINYGEVRGDLQVQTNWTDGTASIEQMALAAFDAGREYIAITDHTKTLAMTGGLDEKKLLAQGKEIDRLNAKFQKLPLPGLSPAEYGGSLPSSGESSNEQSSPPPPDFAKATTGTRGEGIKNKFLPLDSRRYVGVEGGGEVGVKFRILKGAEVNILKDGSLDIDNQTLAKLDVVGVAVHSHFKLSREEQTKRIIRALSNPHADIFFHPTARIIQRREPVDFDFAQILKAAKKFRVALEIDAYPERLDIHDTLVRQAVEKGVKLVIDSDAHNVRHFAVLHFGEAQARRGWAAGSDVLNTKPVEELLKYFAKK